MKMRFAAISVLALSSVPSIAADVLDLHRALEAACSCKVYGVVITGPAIAANVRVDYAPGTTDVQIAQIQAALQSFDFSAPSVPQSVSSMQAKVALSRAGLLSAVQSWVSSQNAEAQLIWGSATTFSRDSAILNGAAAALGLTQAQVDQLFITAAAINP